MVTSMARDYGPADFAHYLIPDSAAAPSVRIAALLAARLHNPRDEKLLAIGLADLDAEVRRVAVQWVAEEKLTGLRPRVEGVFNSTAITADLFMATLAALEMLDGTKPEDIDKIPADKYVLPLLKDEKRSAAVRAQALRLVSPADPALDPALLSRLINGADAVLRQEAVRTLQLAPVERAAPLLVPFAADGSRDKQLRADAVAGLAIAAKVEPPGGAARKVLSLLLNSGDPALRLESLRSLRGLFAADPVLQEALLALCASLVKLPSSDRSDADHELADQIAFGVRDQKFPIPSEIAAWQSQRPQSSAAWLNQLDASHSGDLEAGRRLFYHPNGPGCAKCHTVNGRGGRVGPDLSRIGVSKDRQQLILSILEPGREIAPQYVAWAFETTDGKVLTGMIVHENEGKTTIGDAEGKATELKTIDIVQRVPQAKSIMPEKLPDQMTLQEFRDLIAFLESLK